MECRERQETMSARQASPYLMMLAGVVLFAMAGLVMLRYAGGEDLSRWQARLDRSRAWHVLFEAALFTLAMLIYFLAGAVVR